ncbi:DUF1983 domain-containing protein [Enterobacter hormaechei]|uniref:phage tail tip fiber protein n=1 Tax=Enterobacter cloacae complex TaxID=354276 RepID=UPI000528B0DB|nr:MULTISPECIES: DUF1983 domain-containing protein [Enterobacter cloacae complex]MBT2053546.1 DUF1983 domain-containing protein [Enterobacter hormaechei subsp. hoffmannii]MCU3534303.1 DUF1983 domain-containing protein [Enterobacter hormaechei subsp. steigerwaltii]ASP02695.1 host specificity protein [Enterobacter hormaechei]ELD3275004.1 DUF1983 domain-containing protein [Enterobacter hormaechei]MBJ6543294.1 DUF1983 domain-containing protein [Enterobacter hormaechei]
MSEPSIVPYVKTTPKPFGVDVEWKWPGGCLWLELQYLHEDGRLVKEIIHWPAINYLISGLKAGERLQLRLRPLPVGQDGSARDWRASDWIEGVSSVDTEEIIEALDEEIRNSCALHGLKGGWFVDKTGKAYIHEALIGDGVLSTGYNVKLNVNVTDKGKQHEAGMALDVDDGKSRVKILAEKFAVAANHQNALETALQQSIKKVVDETIQQAMQPGGAIWTSLRRGI